MSPSNDDHFSWSCAIKRTRGKKRKPCRLGSPTQSRRHFSRPRFVAPARTIAHKDARASQLWSSVMATRARGRFYDKQAGKCHLRLSVPSCHAWGHPLLRALPSPLPHVNVNNVKGGLLALPKCLSGGLDRSMSGLAVESRRSVGHFGAVHPGSPSKLHPFRTMIP